jgi:Tfp pilus assembly protein PilF
MAYAALGDDERALTFAEHDPGAIAAKMATYQHTRGSLLERAGKTDAASAAYERALALDPTQGETSVNLGALLGRIGQTKRALEVLSAEIDRHPMAEGALRNRAIVRLNSGDAAGGAGDLDAAFQIRPQAAVARALAQHWKKVGATKVAQQWADVAQRLDPRTNAPR